MTQAILGYLVPEFPAQTHIFFWREIVALRERGVDVRLVSTRRPGVHECAHPFAEEARRTTHYLYPPAGGAVLTGLLAPQRAARALAYVASLRESNARQKARALSLAACAADLLRWARTNGIAHVHSHSCADAAHVVALARAMGGPSFSLALHGDLPVYGVDHEAKMRAASFVSTDGQHLVRQIAHELPGAAHKAFSNPMGVDTDDFRDLGRRSARAGELHLLTVARLHSCKGHVFAFEAVRRLLDEGLRLTYSLAGGGPEREALERQIEQFGLSEHVRLLGTLGAERVRELLQTCDVFLLPSVGLGEAAPVSVMEAMATGMPVVSSIIGSTPDMIDDGVNGFLTEQRDVEAIAAAVRRLATDLELRARISRAAREHAVAAFQTKDSAARLLAAIERTTGRTFAPAG